MLGKCEPQFLWAAGHGSTQMGCTVKSTGEGSVLHTWPHMLQCEVLIRKAASVDRLPSCAIVVGEVASLHTEYLVTNYHPGGRRTVGLLRRQPLRLSGKRADNYPVTKINKAKLNQASASGTMPEQVWFLNNTLLV